MPVELGDGEQTAGPDRQTRVVGGEGSQSLSVPLAKGVFQYVESILVTVDASGAGSAVRPELAIATANGTVIATQRQDDAIPAGDSGSATYALRLAANGGGIRFNRPNVGGYLSIETTGHPPIGDNAVEFAVGAGDFVVRVDDLLAGEVSMTAPFFFFDVLGGIYRFSNSSLFDVFATQTQIAGDQISLDARGTAPNGTAIDGNVVTRLRTAGNTFVVNDHLGAPLMTLTG